MPTVQNHFSETETNTNDLTTMMKEKVSGRNHDDTLNMDQTPTYWYHANKTLDANDVKTVHARASMTDKMPVTLAATVMASGKMLRPFLIFKGKQIGRIAMLKFSTYTSIGKYACQDKA